MFFTIRFGGESSAALVIFSIALIIAANEEQFFNPNCSLDLLVDDIRRRCHSPKACKFAPISIHTSKHGLQLDKE